MGGARARLRSLLGLDTAESVAAADAAEATANKPNRHDSAGDDGGPAGETGDGEPGDAGAQHEDDLDEDVRWRALPHGPCWPWTDVTLTPPRKMVPRNNPWRQIGGLTGHYLSRH